MNAPFSALLLDRWRNVYRQYITDRTGIDCGALSDEALDKIAADLAKDREDDE